MNELSKETEMQNASAIQLLTIDEDSDFPIDGRELHQALGIESKYIDWINRMLSFGFQEGTDFVLVAQKKETNNPKNPFEIKDCYSEKTKWAGNQTMITPRGKEVFRLLVKRWITIKD